MGKRDLEKERQQELAAVWGSEVVGTEGRRVPKRRNAGKKSNRSGMEEDLSQADLSKRIEADRANGLLEDDEENYVKDDMDSLIGSGDDNDAYGASKKKKKRKGDPEKSKKAAKKAAEYRLHCFVEQGTNINNVRAVFEQYNPKVDIRSSQKGNVLNKTFFAVLTFRQKALALHAVQQLDGTNQRDMLGVSKLKLGLMLSREQNKIARRRRRKSVLANVDAKRKAQEAREEAFIQNFMKKFGI